MAIVRFKNHPLTKRVRELEKEFNALLRSNHDSEAEMAIIHAEVPEYVKNRLANSLFNHFIDRDFFGSARDISEKFSLGRVDEAVELARQHQVEIYRESVENGDYTAAYYAIQNWSSELAIGVAREAFIETFNRQNYKGALIIANKYLPGLIELAARNFRDAALNVGNYYDALSVTEGFLHSDIPDCLEKCIDGICERYEEYAEKLAKGELRYETVIRILRSDRRVLEDIETRYTKKGFIVRREDNLYSLEKSNWEYKLDRIDQKYGITLNYVREDTA